MNLHAVQAAPAAGTLHSTNMKAMMTEGEQPNPPDGASNKAIAMAGFSILESLMFSLLEEGVLNKREIYGLLSDAADAHRQRAETAADSNLHIRVAGLIEVLRDGGNTTKPAKWLK